MTPFATSSYYLPKSVSGLIVTSRHRPRGVRDLSGHNPSCIGDSKSKHPSSQAHHVDRFGPLFRLRDISARQCGVELGVRYQLALGQRRSTPSPPPKPSQPSLRNFRVELGEGHPTSYYYKHEKTHHLPTPRFIHTYLKTRAFTLPPPFTHTLTHQHTHPKTRSHQSWPDI